MFPIDGYRSHALNQGVVVDTAEDRRLPTLRGYLVDREFDRDSDDEQDRDSDRSVVEDEDGTWRGGGVAYGSDE